MTTLHIVNKSPFERNSLDSCIRLAKKGSSVLLFEDGIIAAMQNSKFSSLISEAMADVKFFVLGPDIKARGLSDSNVIDGINVIDYDGFVDLTTEHKTVQSWL